MISSMTGFARAERAMPPALICEVRSVNHRFLEAALRMPEELALAGARDAPHVAAAAARKGDATLSVTGAAPARARLDPDLALVALIDRGDCLAAPRRRTARRRSTCCAGRAWCARPSRMHLLLADARESSLWRASSLRARAREGERLAELHRARGAGTAHRRAAASADPRDPRAAAQR